MSSNHTSFTKLALLLVMVGALALAGCGGGDNNGLSAADQARLDQAGVDRMATEQAEADKMAAEQQAEVDRMAAEQAEKDRMAAEQQAEVDRMAAEQAEAAAAAELMGVQTAAATAAMAAKTASDAAAADAKTAMDATAKIATLQTGEMSKMMAYEAHDAAKMAMDAYMAAKMASETANAEDATISSATTARDMAVAEQAKAETAAMTADEKSKGAVENAMTELMIDGMMKSVGGSSVDAKTGMLTDTADDGSKTITGLLSDAAQPDRTIADIPGMMFVEAHQPAANPAVDGVAYKQAIKGGDITIGKTLDTTDDMARLMLITDYRGSKTVRVFADEEDSALTSGVVGLLAAGTATDGAALEDVDTVTATSVGMYYMATPPATDDGTVTDTSVGALDADDQVAIGAEGVKIFKLSGTDRRGADPVPVMDHARIVRTVTTPGGTPVHYYRLVDIDALAAPDDDALATAPAKAIGVTATLPTAMKYSHIHFGVWASLGAADKMGAQKLADLGIGFVQNFSDSGMTEKQGIGTATFNGDWAAAVQRAHGEGEGSIALAEGKAMLVADFGKDTFKGTLTGLATLDGSLSGNGFSGTKATVGANDYGLTAGAEFSGDFEGNIYGPDGEEAGGVFGFSSTSDGAFRGAMGGARDGN